MPKFFVNQENIQDKKIENIQEKVNELINTSVNIPISEVVEEDNTAKPTYYKRERDRLFSQKEPDEMHMYMFQNKKYIYVDKKRNY